MKAISIYLIYISHSVSSEPLSQLRSTTVHAEEGRKTNERRTYARDICSGDRGVLLFFPPPMLSSDLFFEPRQRAERNGKNERQRNTGGSRKRTRTRKRSSSSPPRTYTVPSGVQVQQPVYLLLFQPRSTLLLPPVQPKILELEELSLFLSAVRHETACFHANHCWPKRGSLWPLNRVDYTRSRSCEGRIVA